MKALPFQTRSWLGALRRQSSATGVAALAGVGAFELVNAGALALDEALYPFAETPVRAPLFVIGPPRCGTTRLHRLLAMDPRFTSFQAWQLVFPSVCTQTALRRLARLDGAVGGPLQRAVRRAETRALGAFDPMHVLRVDAPEEDEALLIHAFASELLAIALPYPEVFMEYRAFERLPGARRQALLRYYAGCVQRHLFQAGPERTFLSKNPLFCHKIDSIRQTFPDARFVLILRNPVEVVGSMLSLIRAMRGVVGQARARDQDLMLQFVADCYGNAIQSLERLPESARCTVYFSQLVQSPMALVLGIYDHFGLKASADYRDTLSREEVEARRYRSAHRYDLAELGLSEAEIGAVLRARLGARAAGLFSL